MTARVKWMLISMLCSAVLAGATAWFVTDWALHRHGESHAHDSAEPDLHAWMHEHLDLTPEQHEKLEPIEAEFERQRVQLQSEITAADQALAQALSEADKNDEALNVALGQLNKVQGALQRATLRHFFAMKRHLRPAQAKKLLEWTHDSLTRA